MGRNNRPRRRTRTATWPSRVVTMHCSQVRVRRSPQSCPDGIRRLVERRVRPILPSAVCRVPGSRNPEWKMWIKRKARRFALRASGPSLSQSCAPGHRVNRSPRIVRSTTRPRRRVHNRSAARWRTEQAQGAPSRGHHPNAPACWTSRRCFSPSPRASRVSCAKPRHPCRSVLRARRHAADPRRELIAQIIVAC